MLIINFGDKIALQMRQSCYVCGQSNHSASDCDACFSCGKNGHWMRHCPDLDRGVIHVRCFNCGGKGHWLELCPEAISVSRKIATASRTLSKLVRNSPLSSEAEESKIPDPQSRPSRRTLNPFISSPQSRPSPKQQTQNPFVTSSFTSQQQKMIEDVPTAEESKA